MAREPKPAEAMRREEFGAACPDRLEAARHERLEAQHKATEIQLRADIAREFQQAVVDEMSGLSGFDPTLLTVTITIVSIPNVVTRAIIDVSYPFDTVVGWPGLPQHIALERVVSMPASRP